MRSEKQLERSPSTWTERITIVICLLACCLLMQLTIWKESEVFWLNAGGYPVWLREVLQFIYYPYLLFTGTMLCMLSRSIIGRFFRTLQHSRVWLICALAWCLFFSCLGLLTANNLINLWEGRDLHYHEPIE